MIFRRAGGQLADGRDDSWARCLSLAFAVTLALDASASTQNAPHQSAQRSSNGGGLGQQELPRGATLEPRLEAAVQYADNINLAQDSSDQQNAFGLEVSPGIYAAYNSDNFLGALDYSLIGRAWDDSQYNDVSHELAANGRWKAIPDLFYVDAEASYGDTVIDSRSGLNYGGLGIFGAGNLAEQAAASISPTLRKQFNDLVFHASYSYGRVWYLDEGKGQATSDGVGQEDSRDQNLDVSFGNVKDTAKLTGSIFYNWQKSEFERSFPYQYERAGLDGRFQLSRTLSLVGDVGKETDLDETTTQGGLDSDFWSAGFRWAPDERSAAEARYGERFFGSSYSVDISHRARLLEFTASYSESPQVETRRESLDIFEPGELPPWIDPDANIGFFTASPYVARDARVGINAIGSRTSFYLSGFDIQRNYVEDGFGDEQGTGAAFRASRDLASNMSIDFTAMYSDHERDASTIGQDNLSATHDYDTQFVIRGNRDVGSSIKASLEAGFLNRSGDINYDGWWVGLRGRWTPAMR